MNTTQISTNSSVLIWVVVLGAVFLVLMLLALQLVKATRSPKNMTKKDFEAILSASSAEAKSVTTEALNQIAERLGREFESELSNHIRESLKKFGEKQEKTLGAAVNNYNETLSGIQADVKKYLDTTEKTIAANSIDLDKKVQAAVDAQKEAIVGKVQTKINSILAAYLNQSLSGSIDISSQQDFILEQLEKSKQALIEDIQNVRS